MQPLFLASRLRSPAIRLVRMLRILWLPQMQPFRPPAWEVKICLSLPDLVPLRHAAGLINASRYEG